MTNTQTMQAQALEPDSFCSTLSRVYYLELAQRLHQQADRLLDESFKPIGPFEEAQTHIMVFDCLDSPETQAIIGEGIRNLSQRLADFDNYDLLPDQKTCKIEFDIYDGLDPDKLKRLFNHFEEAFWRLEDNGFADQAS